MMDVLIRYVPRPMAPKKPGSFNSLPRLPIMEKEFNPATPETPGTRT